MEKVLILSYFFPPCNLTPSQRVFSWAKFLYNYGYYPVIITRRWDNKITYLEDMAKPTPLEIIHEKYPEYEVYYLPYKPDLKDKIYLLNSHNLKLLTLLRRFLSFFQLVLQNLFVFFIPYKNIYFFSLNYLNQNKDVKKLIVSANPYILFKFAYKLHRKLDIKWVADYRDAWTNCKIKQINRSTLFNLINSYDRFFEKKWVNTASVITSVSDALAYQISSLVKVIGKSLPNGFIQEDFEKCKSEKPFDKFTISYIGTLYTVQKINIFLEAFKKFIDNNSSPNTILLFPGLAFFSPDMKLIIDNNMKGYEQYYNVSERVEREEALKIEVKSHLLLYVAWKGNTGIIPSRIYEYLASGSYILVAPTDNDVVENIVKTSGCGVCCDSVPETYAFLNDIYSKYLKGIKLVNDVQSDSVKQFSRKLQVQKLANILNQI